MTCQWVSFDSNTLPVVKSLWFFFSQPEECHWHSPGRKEKKQIFCSWSFSLRVSMETNDLEMQACVQAPCIIQSSEVISSPCSNFKTSVLQLKCLCPPASLEQKPSMKVLFEPRGRNLSARIHKYDSYSFSLVTL